jgi:hypothetical protein
MFGFVVRQFIAVTQATRNELRYYKRSKTIPAIVNIHIYSPISV